ncbi:fasciclin domain-containing protein [Cesiribacter sp. SM1]|uniref:fasciclin domain-containing protein n=1 Tax=Cesiribacter sp. SM1 TaxID=2861196 RepID=UPI001CD46919|nr:fasciclin domain-containing protein [Cesiribacter sp. SM1]
MKKRYLKFFAASAVLSAAMFGCTSSGEVSDNTGLEPTQVVVTETEVASGTTPDGSTVVVTDTDVVADTTIMTTARDNMANTQLEYDDMFDDVADTEQYDVLSLARTNPNLSTFVELVELSGLATSLKMADPVTLFIPTNAAFNQLSQERLAELVAPQNRTELMEFVNMHILPQETSSASFNDNSFIDRGEEEDIPVNIEMNGTVVYVGGAQIVKSDVEASNGVIHVLNGVIETTDAAGADID